MKKFHLTSSVRRTAFWYATIMVVLFLFYNFFTLIEINYALTDDVDHKLVHELEHVLHTVYIENDTLKVISEKEFNEKDFTTVNENSYFLQIYNNEGTSLFVSRNLFEFGNLDIGFPLNLSPYYFEDVETEKGFLRTVYKELRNFQNEQIGYIQLSTFQSTFNKVVIKVLSINAITLPIFVSFIFFISVFLAKKTFAPINSIISTADSISASNLSKRLTYDADPDDELGKLKHTLNSLFDRLENQINEISHFTDNASHQLMTPLTTIKTELDYILKKDHQNEEYKETLNILKVQTDRMILMVKSLLIMSREADKHTLINTVFNLSKLLETEIKTMFNGFNIKFNIENNIYIRGNSEYFSVVLQNLISNAIKYSNNELDIKVTLLKQKGKAYIKVEDKGIGIRDEEKEKIFQRFYRSDNDDVQSISGYGLGLSLVKSVINSYNGTIKIYDNKPKGSIFEISVPYLNLS